MGHISPFGTCELYLGGQGVKVNRPKLHYVGQVGGGKRGKISGFSAKSRRRLFQMLGKVNKSVLPLFVTLTYPAEYESARGSKRHVDNFWKRLVRRFPGASCVWKLEPQKRGAPHYHLMLWGVNYSEALSWIGQAWYEVVGSGDLRHFRAGTRVEKVRTWRGALSYASKYLGKVEDIEGWGEPGRFWGVLGRENIPWAMLARVVLTDRQAVLMIRYLRRCCHIQARAYRSLNVNVGDASFWYDRLDRLLF